METFWERITEFIKSRLFIMLCTVFLLFSLMVLRLFNLQIVNGEQYQQELRTTIMNTVTLPASRGNIYDRYGRPLAVNEVAFSIKIDASAKIDIKDKRSDFIIQIANYLESRGTPLMDTLPITKSYPYEFIFSDEKEETDWKTNVLGSEKSKLKMSASETLDYLYDLYEIPSSYDETFKRKIISIAIKISDRDIMLLNLIETLEKNNENIIDNLPISFERPYQFLFDNNKNKEIAWKKSVEMKTAQQENTAAETIDYLVDYFGMPDNLPDDIERKLISLRYTLFEERYRKYKPVTISVDVSNKTVASVEEKQDIFPGIIVDTDSLRKYPEGEYFSHILGYIRKIDANEYSVYSQYKDEEGNQIYSSTDIIGKSGLESTFELDLNGTDGEMLVEVDSTGRRISTIESKQPVSGKNIYLTLDARLQEASFKYLEESLKNVLVAKLRGTSSNIPITLKKLFISMVSNNNISVSKICNATEGEQANIKNLILAENPDFILETSDDLKFATQVVNNGIENGTISTKQMTLVLFEQGLFEWDEDYINRIQRGNISPLSVILQKLESGELRPADTACDPCTGSVVVSRVDSGEVLALVTYPSYDNNEFVNNFNNTYYNELLSHTNTSPLLNRPIIEKKAPGSTFKMITSIAALQTGVISPSSTIYDRGEFTKASWPYAKCLIYSSRGGSHGDINVSHALEVSCNYFFYEIAYRMGNAQEGTTEDAIAKLNEYMSYFGLNDVTGIELRENAPNMASPEYKKRSIEIYNPDASSSQTRWTDGDTIRASIGQSVNNYTAANMTKYVATLANGGTLYKMHLLDKIENPDGTLNRKVEEEIQNVLEIDERNLDAVYKGMLMVTQGSKGTLRNVFKDFPIDVAAKSGTAEEQNDRSSHTVFVSFSPYDDPQISVTVMIPYGEATGSPAAVVARNIIAEYMGLNYVPENTNMTNILAK